MNYRNNRRWSGLIKAFTWVLLAAFVLTSVGVALFTTAFR